MNKLFSARRSLFRRPRQGLHRPVPGSPGVGHHREDTPMNRLTLFIIVHTRPVPHLTGCHKAFFSLLGLEDRSSSSRGVQGPPLWHMRNGLRQCLGPVEWLYRLPKLLLSSPGVECFLFKVAGIAPSNRRFLGDWVSLISPPCPPPYFSFIARILSRPFSSSDGMILPLSPFLPFSG